MRFTVDRVVESLDHVLSLARRAAQTSEPARAALLITGALEDLGPELRALRGAARKHLAEP